MRRIAVLAVVLLFVGGTVTSASADPIDDLGSDGQDVSATFSIEIPVIDLGLSSASSDLSCPPNCTTPRPSVGTCRIDIRGRATYVRSPGRQYTDEYGTGVASSNCSATRVPSVEIIGSISHYGAGSAVFQTSGNNSGVGDVPTTVQTLQTVQARSTNGYYSTGSSITWRWQAIFIIRQLNGTVTTATFCLMATAYLGGDIHFQEC